MIAIVGFLLFLCSPFSARSHLPHLHRVHGLRLFGPRHDPRGASEMIEDVRNAWLDPSLDAAAIALWIVKIISHLDKIPAIRDLALGLHLLHTL